MTYVGITATFAHNHQWAVAINEGETDISNCMQHARTPSSMQKDVHSLIHTRPVFFKIKHLASTVRWSVHKMHCKVLKRL